MGVGSLKYIKVKNKAGVFKISETVQEFLGEIYHNVNKNELKYLPSFIELVCCAIEEAFSKPTIENKKVSKKDEAFNQLAKFLNITLTEQDKIIIGNIIEDLHSSGRIKRVSYLQKAKFKMATVFLRKA